ncbi:MAG: aspartate aminotransferase family protein [Bacteroidia bacterium]
MQSNRQLFLQHVAQTSPAPLALEIVKAEGIYLYDNDGKKLTDLISGISVSNVGHRHPKVVQAVKDQSDRYMHLMVYGEYVQSPQVRLAERISELLPPTLNCTYFTNSGAEAIEGALKLAKRITGRSELVSFHHSYHGSTHGALSIMGSEFFKTAFRPLLPDTRLLHYNDLSDLHQISEKTACVVVEPVQAEAGVIKGNTEFLQALRKRCDETGTLLIFDEIQTGFGRTGKLFGFEHSGVIPDVIVFAKGMGGGMPIGAFVSSRENMLAFTENPVLGHITTFGGHPVSCAAALATINIITEEKLHEHAAKLEAVIHEELKHPAIQKIHCCGLMCAVYFRDFETNKKFIDRAIEKGVITDWFLFCDNAMRIGPPLIISEEQLRENLRIISSCLE